MLCSTASVPQSSGSVPIRCPIWCLWTFIWQTGLPSEIFEHISITCPIIFTTAYDEYALRAFKVNSIDYLLKPIGKEDIEHSFEKLNSLNCLR